MTWLVFGVIIYAVWKIRPRHLLKDVLEMEWISSLQHQRNSRPISAEDVEKRFYRKLTAFTVVMFVSILITLTTVIAWTVAMPVAAIVSALGAVAVLRYTTLSRTIRTPLYLTLCGIRESRWDTHSNPRKWVRVTSRDGTVSSVTILLPKDWHASTLGMVAITSIVESRLPGLSNRKVELDRFRVTYSRPAKPVSVPVKVDTFPVANAVAHIASTVQNADAENSTESFDTVNLVKQEEGIDAW